MIILKNERDLEVMRRAGVVAATVLEEVALFIQPGVSTREVDEFAAARIKFYEAKSAFFGLPQISVPYLHFRSMNRWCMDWPGRAAWSSAILSVWTSAWFIAASSGTRRGRWRWGDATCRRNG